jgi:hypothetical protein
MLKTLLIVTALSSFLTGLETKTLKTDFTLAISENVSQPLNITGTITVHGEQFLLSALDYDAAYDGKTFYLWQPDTEELTLSTPTKEELLEINPFLFAKALDAAGKKVNFVIDDKQLPVRAQMSDGKTNYSLTFRNAQYITTPVSYTITPPDGAFINDIR